MSGTKAVLDVRSLTKVYSGGLVANDRVTVSVDGGEVVGLLGHNGAGKTTLVRQVVGLSRPTDGAVRIAGVDVVADPGAARRLSSLQAQTPVPIGGMSPRRAVTLVGRMRGLSARAAATRVDELADRLDLGEWLDHPSVIGEDVLSGGVRRLVSFCLTVVAPGRLVVLDEPTNDVDPLRRRLLWAEVRRLANEGHAVVLVTHNVVEAERCVDRVALMAQGRVVAEGTPASLTEGVRGRLRLDLRWTTAQPPAVPAFVHSRTRTARGFTAVVDREHVDRLLAWGEELRMRGQVEHFAVGTAGLEDVYARMMTTSADSGGSVADHVEEEPCGTAA